MLFLGVFFPILQIGNDSLSLFNASVAIVKNGASATFNTNFSSLLVLVSALVSAYFILKNRNKFTIISNIVATLSLLYSLLNVLAFANDFNIQQAAFQKQIQSAFYGSGFANSFAGPTKSYDINWFCWLVLLAGVGVIFYAVRADLMPFAKMVQSKIAAISSKASSEMKKDEKAEIKKDEIEAKKEVTQEVKTEVRE